MNSVVSKAPRQDKNCAPPEKHKSHDVIGPICGPSAELRNGDSSSSSTTSTAAATSTAASGRVVGLVNLGNTCFFNSSVQLLLACAPLQGLLAAPEHTIGRGPIGYALQQAALFTNGAAAGTVFSAQQHCLPCPAGLNGTTHKVATAVPPCCRPWCERQGWWGSVQPAVAAVCGVLPCACVPGQAAA